MTTTPDTLAPKLSDKLITLLKCLPEAPFKDHLIAEIEALAAQALPAAEPVNLDVMPIFWKCFRHFPSTAGALTHTVWKDGIDIDKLSAPMQRFCDELVQAAQQAAQATAGWVPIETAEEGLLYVVSWVDPDDGLERHDFDHLEDGVWQQHADSVEHFQMCAPPGSRGPKDQPPYTHCLKLGALPQPQPQSAQAKGDAS